MGCARLRLHRFTPSPGRPPLRAVASAIALILLAATAARAQDKGATITGIVVDSAMRGIPGADVVARPGGHRVRSDSAGRFRIGGLDDGTYLVVARKVGFAPEQWDVKLADDGRVDLRFVLGRRVVLDTIVVVARDLCPAHSLDGFMCRRHGGGGIFLDYPEIDETGARETAEIFRTVPGFRVEVQSATGGTTRVARLASRSGCIASLVDGRPASAANAVPRFAADLAAVEIYLRPDSVPEVYRRHTWPTSGTSRTGRCALVVYWTIWAPYKG